MKGIEMNALTRLERMDELFPEMFRRLMRPMTVAGQENQAEIRLDVTERDKDFLVRAEVPGAKKDDVRVQIERNYVSISTEVKQQKETKDDKTGRVLLQESSWGSAMRAFSLPCEIDDKASSAKLEDGVLTLTLPKREGGGSRMLPVQ
jgi:HSP20 family protein